MFTVDEATAAAIRQAYETSGELAGVVELRRHFPLIADNAHARMCVRMIVEWTPLAEPPLVRGRRRPPRAAQRGGE